MTVSERRDPGDIAGSSRGVLFPARLPDFHRIPPPPELERAVRWFWISRWDVAPGQVSRQAIVAFPASNLVVERDAVGLSGPSTLRSHRDLEGEGLAVAALLQPAAVPAIVGDPAEIVDEYRLLQAPDTDDLRREVCAAVDSAPDREAARHAAVGILGDYLLARVPADDAEGALANRMAELADGRTDLLTVEALAQELAVSVRTVQRLARRYVGVGPRAMIRRRRLQEAAERVRLEPGVDLASIAHDLGYADHAHLTGDFRRVLGFTPSGYRRDAAGH